VLYDNAEGTPKDNKHAAKENWETF